MRHIREPRFRSTEACAGKVFFRVKGLNFCDIRASAIGRIAFRHGFLGKRLFRSEEAQNNDTSRRTSESVMGWKPKHATTSKPMKAKLRDEWTSTYSIPLREAPLVLESTPRRRRKWNRQNDGIREAADFHPAQRKRVHARPLVDGAAIHVRIIFAIVDGSHGHRRR